MRASTSRTTNPDPRRRRVSPWSYLIGSALIAQIAIGGGLLAAQTAVEEPPEGGAKPGVWEEVQRLYEKAKDKGERVPKDIYEWAREDLGAIGDWEYRILTLDDPTPESLQEELNGLGVERWDCFWIERRRDDLTLYLKRPSRTYLRHIPFSDLMQIIPSGDSGSSSTE